MKKHILLIDDDKDELTIFMDALRKVPHDDGFKCTWAESAEHAIEMLKYLVPDYIFADFNIPGTNGPELLEFIKDQQRFEKTKLCFYSAAINDPSGTRAAALGAYSIQKASAIDLLARDLSRFFEYNSEPHYSFCSL